MSRALRHLALLATAVVVGGLWQCLRAQPLPTEGDTLRATKDSVRLERRQDDAEQDSAQVESDTAWDDTERAWRELEEQMPEDFELDEMTQHYSHGWFPQAGRASSLSVMGEFLYADVHDRGENLRSRSFAPTAFPFSWHNPFDGAEQEILEAGSMEEEDDGYPDTRYAEYCLRYLYHLPLPAIAFGDLSLQITDGMLYSLDTTRSYLTLSGLKRPLREVGVVNLSQYSLAGAVGVHIPVYGAFIESDVITIHSYYYLRLGLSAAYAIASYGTQYLQIAAPKEELRYSNARDTVTLQDRRKLADLNRWRTGIELGIGWTFGAEFGTFGFEAFLSIPQTDVLRGTPWRQYFAGIRMGVGYQWVD